MKKGNREEDSNWVCGINVDSGWKKQDKGIKVDRCLTGGWQCELLDRDTLVSGSPLISVSATVCHCLGLYGVTEYVVK